jgi:formate dehydrogenase maturation protein FdhE
VGGKVFKRWSGIVRRECGGCGHPYQAEYRWERGKEPKSIPLTKTCSNCGRYLKDAAKKRGWRYDPHYERGDSWS